MPSQTSPTERHRRASELFLEVCELPLDKRPAHLDVACRGDDDLRREIEGLLARDAAPSSFLEGAPLGRPPFEAILAEAGPTPAETYVPERIGAYRVTGVLGRGGMGVVYRAEQERPRRQVALKVIRSGFASAAVLRRFEHEAQVLARLAHPGIAQVYEAGVVPATGPGSEPVPFFAMELVEGEQLGTFAARADLRTRDRLELFARVCDAVQYAHTKGVVHRDLKPANVLICADGQPKILDFGVARATDADVQATTLRTDVGQVLGTLAYMSPEQLAADPGDIDTRSDVYALGATLYELLCGRPAQDVGGRMLHEAARVIREERPAKLSSISPHLRGEVETIVGKALEKDRGRRYQSAAELAADIRRYLRHEPIAARPPSAAYRLRKLATRHKGAFAAGSLAILALIAGAVGSAWQAHHVGLERDAAAVERDRAQGVTEWFINSLRSQDPDREEGRQDITVSAAMQQSLVMINRGDLKDRPATEATVLRAIARVLDSNGRSAEALDPAERALKIERELHPGDHPAVASAIDTSATVHLSLGHGQEASKLSGESVAMRRRLSPGDDPATASSINELAMAMQELGRYADAAALLEESLEMRRRLYPGDHAAVAQSLNNLADVNDQLANPERARMLFEQSLAMYQRLYSGDHPQTAKGLINVAMTLRATGNLAEGEKLVQQALEMNQRIYKGDHPIIATNLNNLAFFRNYMGKPEEAERLLTQALEMSRRLYPGDHSNIAIQLNNVAKVREKLGRAPEAEPLYRESIAMYGRMHGDDHPVAAAVRLNLATCLASMGRFDEAAGEAQTASTVIAQKLEPGHPDRGRASDTIAKIERMRAK